MVSRHALRTRGRTYSERFGKIRREMRDARCEMRGAAIDAAGIRHRSHVNATSMRRARYPYRKCFVVRADGEP
ncbi:hypothetical protein A8H31_25875 [Burkholderia thailandensis]|nr:hypothetical protein A8H31_25875 [Burkholderia thailandensis]PHH38111.1 hypothetical protein CRX59_16975 [Burkholderia thailandensis]PNE67583.1 hypothetical protein A8H38_14920 [Burkholderia thailandensis]PNE79577.1 hypothetical protein A8H34_15475 [Burkholderia thailandensis]PNE85517.1 hypothetical protein A8H30_15125 [Burkholderia thailandensis]